MTALPIPPAELRAHTTDYPQTREDSPSPEFNMPYKKSFQTLRKRSESIGNAIRFVSGAKKGTRDSKVPPTPTAVPPLPSGMDYRKSVDLSNFPSPPPPMPSPRGQLRKSVTSAHYSPFPDSYSGNKGIVGLGIRT